MINLIPNKEKKQMVQDFYYRLVAVVLATLGWAVLVGAIALVPAYVLSSVKKDVARVKTSNLSSVPAPTTDQSTLEAIQDLNSKISFIEKSEKSRFAPSVMAVDQVLLDKMPDIKITEISYEASLGKKITLRGEAPSRERLLAFRQALEANRLFKKVDLPISNFVKESDIKFYLTINLE
jgi:hypothetical protein